MSIETLGEAYRLGWRLRVRCVRGYVDSPVRVPAVRSSSGLGHADARMGQGTELPLGQGRQPAHVSQMWEQRSERDLRAATDGEDSRKRQRLERKRLMSVDEC